MSRAAAIRTRAAQTMRRLVGRFPLAFERTGGTGGYTWLADDHAAGAPLRWTAEGMWSTVGTTPAEQSAGGSDPLRTAVRRVLMVAGDTLTAADGAAPGAPVLIPQVDDKVIVEGRSYQLTAATPVAAPAGGLAPLYRLEAEF